MLLRPAEPADALAVARVHVQSWQAAYRMLLPEEYLDQLRPEDRAETCNFASSDPREPRTIVATEGEMLLGFVTTAPSRDADLQGYGEVFALYVDPKQWGRGVGAALVSAGRNCLREGGYRNACLWVMVGNVRGERFYRGDGWVDDGVRRTIPTWGVTVDEVRYRRGVETP